MGSSIPSQTSQKEFDCTASFLSKKVDPNEDPKVLEHNMFYLRDIEKLEEEWRQYSNGTQGDVVTSNGTFAPPPDFIILLANISK